MIYGLDLSCANGTVDAKKIAAAGKVFAICKATDGVGSPGTVGDIDPMFFRNVAELSGAGLDVAAYHYLHVRDVGRDDYEVQADQFCAAMDRAIGLSLRPWVDLEDACNHGRTSAQVLDGLHRFDARVTSVRGVGCVLYTYPAFWIGLGVAASHDDLAAAMPLAIAHYIGEREPHVPLPWTDWAMHQYAAGVGVIGHCDGVTGAVDLDRFDGNIDELRAF